MELHANYITNKNGKPISVVLPIEEFKKMVEDYGIDLSKEEADSILKNKGLRSKNSAKIDSEYTNLKEL